MFSSSLNDDDDFEKVGPSYDQPNDLKSFDTNLVTDLKSGSSATEQLIDKQTDLIQQS